MPMMIYRRSDKPEDLHPRTELAGKFLKKDENVAWKMADIQVPPPIPDDTAVPNVLRDERGLLRKDFLPAWHLKLEKQDLGMNMAARRLQASWRGFITRKRMVVSRETMKTVELRYLHRKVHQLQHERREQAAARESWLAAEAAKRPNPSVEELRSGRLRCMSSQVELGTLSTSSFISYSNQPGFDPTALGASTELFAAQRRPKRSADLDPRRAFIHQLERPRSPDAGRVITNNSGGMMSESMVWQPRKVGARPKTAPLNEGLTLLGARPATSGSSANGGMLGTGKLPPYKRRKKRKPRTAPADLTRTASIKSLGPDANESMSDEMLRQMRFDRMVEPIRPAVPVGYHSERTRQVARKDPRKIGANTLMDVFMSADADKSGELNTSELRQCLVDLELGLNEDELDRLVQDCDTNGDGSFDYREFLPMMQSKLTILAQRKSAGNDFSVAACNSTRPLPAPSPVCTKILTTRWPPPLHMWLAEQGFPVSAESGFRYKGYNTVDDLLQRQFLDQKELRLCGVPSRAE